MCISINALKKYYGRHMGIESVDLKVESGEFYGFIGPNGAGKSTTLKILMTILFPTSGTAFINENDVTLSEMKIKPFIGYLPSDVNLYSEITVKALFNMNIQYYSTLKLKDKDKDKDIDIDAFKEKPRFYSLSTIARKQFLEKELERLTQYLQVDVSKKFKELSFGNQKKVGYILCVLHNPEIILLDEPTNGLDPLIKERIFEDLVERNKRGVTIFFSSHNLDEIERHCSKVAFIKEGRILKVTTIESLKELSLKNVTIKLPIEKATEAIEKLSQYFKIERREDRGYATYLHFQLTSDISMALKHLSEIDLLDINIESPSLEEIFKFYY